MQTNAQPGQSPVVTPRSDILIGNLTHVGMMRKANQDYYGFWEPPEDDAFERLGRILVVCDGVGGQAGGEVASRLAVRTILEAYGSHDGSHPGEGLERAIQAANLAVFEESERRPEVKDMATTVVALVFHHGTVYVAHVGDSRCYRIRDGALEQLTTDHSLVQQMVIEGLLDEADMETHPRKNVILRSLGMRPDLEVDLSDHPYTPGDIYLISSDGLTGMVGKADCLRLAVQHQDDPAEACAALIQAANHAGGQDNIAVQMARVVSMESGPADGPPVRLYPDPEELIRATDDAVESGANVTGTIGADEVARIREEALRLARQQRGSTGEVRTRRLSSTAPVVATYSKLGRRILEALRRFFRRIAALFSKKR